MPAKGKKVSKSTVVASRAVTDVTPSRKAAIAILTLIETPMRTRELLVLIEKVAGIVEEAINEAKVSPQP